jgi:hypothetical protein
MNQSYAATSEEVLHSYPATRFTRNSPHVQSDPATGSEGVLKLTRRHRLRRAPSLELAENRDITGNSIEPRSAVPHVAGPRSQWYKSKTDFARGLLESQCVVETRSPPAVCHADPVCKCRDSSQNSDARAGRHKHLYSRSVRGASCLLTKIAFVCVLY